MWSLYILKVETSVVVDIHFKSNRLKRSSPVFAVGSNFSQRGFRMAIVGRRATLILREFSPEGQILIFSLMSV